MALELYPCCQFENVVFSGSVEPMLDMIADFVITGRADTEHFPCQGAVDSLFERIVQSLERFPLVVWIIAVLLIVVSLDGPVASPRSRNRRPRDQGFLDRRGGDAVSAVPVIGSNAGLMHRYEWCPGNRPIAMAPFFSRVGNPDGV